MKGRGDPPTNPPLWVKLNFMLGEVPPLVDTWAQFLFNLQDVMQTLADLGVKAKKCLCRFVMSLG